MSLKLGWRREGKEAIEDRGASAGTASAEQNSPACKRLQSPRPWLQNISDLERRGCHVPFPPNLRFGWVLGFVENAESEKREPRHQDRPPLRLIEGLWEAGGNPPKGRLQVGPSDLAQEPASGLLPNTPPGSLRWAKAHSAPQRGGSIQPQRARLSGLLVFGTKHQDLPFTDGYRHLGSEQL